VEKMQKQYLQSASQIIAKTIFTKDLQNSTNV
jgi:hypothetical protein